MLDWQSSLPGLHDLYCASDVSHPDNYFHNFGEHLMSPCAASHYAHLEEERIAIASGAGTSQGAGG